MTQNRVSKKQQAMSNGHVSAPPTISGRKLPDSFQLKKFIALPQGFRIKTPGNDQDCNLPRKPVPIKAVPLGLDGHTPVNSDYNGDISSFFTQPEPGKLDSSLTNIPYRRTDSISSIDSIAGSEFSDFSLNSNSTCGKRGRYRKRSQSTPPDIGRQRSSPVDRKIEQKIKTEYNQILNQLQKGNLNSKSAINGHGRQNGGNLNTGFSSIEDWSDTGSRSSLDSLDLNDSTDWDVTFTHQSVPNTGNHFGHNVNPTGQTTNNMHPQYLTLPRNFLSTTGGGELRGYKMDSVNRPVSSAHMNGSVYRNNGLVVYKPLSSGEFIMVGNHPEDSHGMAPGDNRSVTEKHRSNLYKSRVLSSSMPTLLDPKAKVDKKLLKEIKRREKEERKLLEKEERRKKEEEKRRVQEEKKRKKSILKEQKRLEKLGTKNRTLPKNWAYLNKPIEDVYSRPHHRTHTRPQLSLSAVPIDFEDGPATSQRSVAPNQPPPPPPPFLPESSTATKALYASAPDLLRLEQVYGATIRGHSQHNRKYSVPNRGPVYIVNQLPANYVSDYAPRTVVLQKGPEGYGFILRGAKSQSTRNGELDFHPTPEFPALQYLDDVDPGSRADRAGLKPGDFILEINGENVVRASHDRVVQVIRHSGETLAMKVVTVRPQENPVNWQHTDGTMTLPTRGMAGNKKQAPQPPRRDPRTSLSKEKGKQIAEGLNELDQLDIALAEFERETRHTPSATTEQKTASIRVKHASKRVSCVDLSNIEGYDSEKSDHRSPSERIIHKYNNERKISAMDRSQSTPDLTDKKPEPLYATPVVPGSAGVQRKNDGVNIYAIPGEDNLSMKSFSSTMERPKGPPPPPPGTTWSKRPAPGLPKDGEVVHPSKTEVVSINTTGSRTSLYARPETKIATSTQPEQDYESSFRPGASAKMTDEPKIKMKAHQRNSSLTSTKSADSGGSRQSDDKHSVSFAEDKVFDSAKTYLQKHPNAKLLVTADVHTNVKNKSSSNYEPEPDYDMEDDKTRSKITVISVGDRKTSYSDSKRYTVRSDIPADSIPPPPSEPAPQPPKMKSMAPTQPITKSAAPPQPMVSKSAAPTKPPSPKSKVPSPKMEEKKKEVIIIKKEEKVKPVEVVASAPPGPPMPPPAPAPPPAPPLPPSEPPAPPLPKSTPPALGKVEPKVKPNNTTPQGIQAGDLLAAIQKRQQRMDIEGPKISALPQNKDGPPVDDNQAAIIAAVARRRRMLEEKGEKSVVNVIESKLQKTKKLQSAKLAFSSDNIGKTPEPIRKSPVTMTTKEKTDTKVNTKVDIKSIGVKQPPKVEVKPISKMSTINKEPTKPVSTVNGKDEKIPKTEIKKVDKPVATSTPKAENKENSVSSPGGTDYVALAEKARQEYLQKKASQSSIRVTPTNNTPTNKPINKTPTKTTPMKTENSTNSVKTVARDQNKNIISTGKDRTKVFSSVSQIPNGNLKNNTSSLTKNKENGVTSLKPTKDTDVIKENKTSIRDRIASLNKTEKNTAAKMNGKVPNEKMNLKGVTLESSVTEKSPLPPPPEFGDSVQVEIIPPPTGFDSGSNVSNVSRQSSVFNQEDNESLVSSVSTISTLSDDHADSGYGRQRHNFEELIAPPPPGFGDLTADQSYETIPSVIPPPPDFGEGKNGTLNKSKQTSKPFSAKSIDSWQCLDVLDWLDSLKYSQYKSSFQQKCIDGKRLQNLSRNDYLDLGVTQVGHRMNLERSIKKLNLPKNVVSSSHL